MKGTTKKTRLVAGLLAYSLRAFGVGASEEAPSTCNLQIPRLPLDDALQEVARQCDVQLVYFSEITTGLNAPELGGRYAIDDALHLLLKSTGLSFSRVNPRTLEIRRAADDNLSTVADVNGKRSRGGYPLASPSFLPEVIIGATAEGLAATRVETPLREIPQTLSIVSAEQMRQQNNFDFGDTLDDAVGITALRRDSLHQSFYSRGFEITNYTLDGGGALRPFAQFLRGSILVTPDSSEYDHVEILRGADALFSADGLPGGAVNLIRKRPLSTATILSSTSAGSWNNFRQEVDATGPLALDGALRGRLDVTYGQKDYFLDRAHDERKSVFGVLDYELTPATLLTIGGSYTADRALPFWQGLPRLSTGVDPRLPRSTSYVFDWSHLATQVREGYLRLEQALGDRWHLKVNATLLNQSLDYAAASFIPPINAATGGIPTPPFATYSSGPSRQKQFNVEATLTGSAQWLGHREEFAFGGDFRRARATSLTGETSFFGPPLANAAQFDPAAYPDPRNDPSAALSNGESVTNISSGLFSSLRVFLTQRWSIVAGLRVSNESIADDSDFYFFGETFSVPAKYEYNGKVTPNVGMLFALNSNFSLYASYADIYLSNGGVIAADGKQLRPSDGIDIEGGVKAAWHDGALNGTFAVYKIIQRGVALFDPNVDPTSALCCYTSSGRNISRGVDLELTGKLTPGWLIGAGYTFNNNAQSVAGSIYTAPLTEDTPRHLLKAWTSYRLPGAWGRWNVGGSLRAQSTIYNDSVNCPVTDDQGLCLSKSRSFRVVQKSHAVADTRVGYQLGSHWQLALNVNNVVDKRYYQTLGTLKGGNWYGEPRSFMVRLDGRY